MPTVRRNDLAGASRPDVFIANSSFVAQRIAKYYRRDVDRRSTRRWTSPTTSRARGARTTTTCCSAA